MPAYTHLNGYFSSSAGIQCKESIIQLDEKFIPDTIARASDLVQPDWDQTDETALDFIKNKPIEETEDDAMEMLFDMGIIIPAVDDGAILTDENGNILVI